MIIRKLRIKQFRKRSVFRITDYLKTKQGTQSSLLEYFHTSLWSGVEPLMNQRKKAKNRCKKLAC